MATRREVIRNGCLLAVGASGLGIAMGSDASTDIGPVEWEIERHDLPTGSFVTVTVYGTLTKAASPDLSVRVKAQFLEGGELISKSEPLRTGQESFAVTFAMTPDAVFEDEVTVWYTEVEEQ